MHNSPPSSPLLPFAFEAEKNRRTKNLGPGQDRNPEGFVMDIPVNLLGYICESGTIEIEIPRTFSVSTIDAGKPAQFETRTIPRKFHQSADSNYANTTVFPDSPSFPTIAFATSVQG